MIKFDATFEEMELITKICQRAFTKDYVVDTIDPMSLDMDITATHCNGCKLDLERFLNADDFNFFHDIYGIIKHINRKTGKLENYFLPRFAITD